MSFYIQMFLESPEGLEAPYLNGLYFDAYEQSGKLNGGCVHEFSVPIEEPHQEIPHEIIMLLDVPRQDITFTTKLQVTYGQITDRQGVPRPAISYERLKNPNETTETTLQVRRASSPLFAASLAVQQLTMVGSEFGTHIWKPWTMPPSKPDSPYINTDVLDGFLQTVGLTTYRRTCSSTSPRLVRSHTRPAMTDLTPFGELVAIQTERHT